MGSKAPGSNGQQLGRCGEVPVGIGDFGVADVGRQGENVTIDIQVLRGPAFESMADKRMAKIMDTGSSMVAAGTPL